MLYEASTTSNDNGIIDLCLTVLNMKAFFDSELMIKNAFDDFCFRKRKYALDEYHDKCRTRC